MKGKLIGLIMAVFALSGEVQAMAIGNNLENSNEGI